MLDATYLHVKMELFLLCWMEIYINALNLIKQFNIMLVYYIVQTQKNFVQLLFKINVEIVQEMVNV